MVKAKFGYATIFISLIMLLIYYSIYSNTTYRESYISVKEDKAHLEEPVRHEKLLNIDFQYILNNKSVCKDETFVLIMVTSYYGNTETRSAMRRTFSADDLAQIKFRRIFLLGFAPSDKYTSQKAIEDESRRFGDIIQGNFIEAYRNLTYKHVMGLGWAAQYCSQANFVIKMDDDIVVNVDRIPKLLEMFSNNKQDSFIAGYILRNMSPIREPANKWFVTNEEYSSNKYPPFVSGWFYITTPKTCLNLYKTSKTMKFFWIDDAFVTGILAKLLRIRHYDISKYFTVHSEFLDCCVNDIRMKNTACDILIGPNGGNNNLFFDFNNAVAICNLKLCKPRTIPMNRTCVAEKKFNLGRGQAVVESYRLH